MVFVVALVAAACGDDSGSDDSSAATGDGGADTTETSAPSGADDAEGADGDGGATAPSEGGSGAGGTVVIGDETMALEDSLCLLEEQDVSGSPGKILFSTQARGVNAAGEPVVLDVSRYDEESLFAGDDVAVIVGDQAGDYYEWISNTPIGTITVEGSVVSADDLTLRNTSDNSESVGSFQLNC